MLKLTMISSRNVRYSDYDQSVPRMAVRSRAAMWNTYANFRSFAMQVDKIRSNYECAGWPVSSWSLWQIMFCFVATTNSTMQSISPWNLVKYKCFVCYMYFLSFYWILWEWTDTAQLRRHTPALIFSDQLRSMYIIEPRHVISNNVVFWHM